MKPILFFTLMSMIWISSMAQDCSNPITPANFQSEFNAIASQATNQKKLDRSLELTSKSCLMSSQVKNIALLFSEDNYRIEFCRAAYLTTFDRVNFYDVYDAFTSFSYALRLYDFTRNPKQALPPFIEKVEKTIEKPIEPIKPKFAEIVYPSISKYTGNKGCNGPVVDDATFNTLALQVASQPTDEAKNVAIETGTEETCFSLAQIMKLSSLMLSEKLRYKTLNATFTKVYDQDHYMSARALFASVDLQNQWVAAAKFSLTPPETPCVVEEADMKAVIKSLQSKNFPSEKLDLLGAIKKDKCFNVAQVTTLSKEFAFDKDKIEALKMLYAGCPDKSNYFKLIDELDFGYMRDDLTAFIKKEGGN